MGSNIEPIGVPGFATQDQGTAPKNRVYCRDCRFLRWETHNGKFVVMVGPFKKVEAPSYICIAPDNITRSHNWLSCGELTTCQTPHERNARGDCPAFEAVEECVGVFNLQEEKQNGEIREQD